MEEKYKFEPGMREISGFGGTYEGACRVMLKSALEWSDEHPDTDPKFSQIKNVIGYIKPENKDAEDMLNTMIESVRTLYNSVPTGAMAHITIVHFLFIKKYGWNEYVEYMTKEV